MASAAVEGVAVKGTAVEGLVVEGAAVERGAVEGTEAASVVEKAELAFEGLAAKARAATGAVKQKDVVSSRRMEKACFTG